MMRHSSLSWIFLFLAVISLSGSVTTVSAAAVPPGSRLSIRLQQAVSSQTSRPGDVITAALLSPVTVGDQVLLPAGTGITGQVADPGERKRTDHSVLLLRFGTLPMEWSKPLPFDASVVEVDNARESVDAEGVIHGLRPVSRKPTGVEDLLLLAAAAHPAVLASLELGKFIVAEREKPRVRYPAGTELFLQLTKPLHVPDSLVVRARSGVDRLDSQALPRYVESLPLRTTAGNDRSSDLINVAILGSEDALLQAFSQAGWSSAADLDLKTEAKAFFAVAIHHSYREAPVSRLRLQGAVPTHVFEKSLNTFSKRHHIRVWRSEQRFDGQDVWVCAATHDIGIDFSRQARTFSHSVDRDIDLERQKVFDDLTFTGAVRSSAMVPRPNAPQYFQNATGDRLHTDGAIAVLQLK